MSPIDVNKCLFVVAAIAFAWIGFRSARKQASPADYFHDPRLKQNVVSLTATNITLGTGLVYLVSGAEQNGLLMLLPVFCVFLGYWLLSELLERATAVAVRSGRNFLWAVDAEIARTTGKRTAFAKVVSGSLIAVFVLLLAFEIFASAKVICPFLFEAPTQQAEVALSLVIFVVTVAYAILGGVRAVFGVDILQVPLICVFLPVFVAVAVPDLMDPAAVASRLVGRLDLSRPVLVTVGIACINSICTQFYSLINWGAVSNVELRQQKTLLRRVGAATAIALGFFVLAGLLHPGAGPGRGWQDLMERFSSFVRTPTVTGYLASGAITLGMASILLTTTDAVVVNAVLFTYDNFLQGDSRATKGDARSLRHIRLVGVGALAVAFAILCAINYAQPDPFYLLLSMAGGVIVFAPMIATAAYLTSNPSRLRVFSPTVVWVYFAVFAASGVLDVILLSKKSSLVPYVGVAAFACAMAVSVALLVRVRGGPPEADPVTPHSADPRTADTTNGG